MATVSGADLGFLDELKVPYHAGALLGPHTWYRVGGPVRALAHPQSVEQLSQLARRCAESNQRVLVLGAGANLLVADQGVDAIVVKLDAPCFHQIEQNGNKLTVGAGYDLAKLVLHSAKLGLGGLDVLAGIPATVGGAVRMNAGGAFGDTGRSVSCVHVMDAAGHPYERTRDDLVFSYRRSNIVAPFILRVEFDLTPDDPDQLMKRVKEVFLYKKNTQPLAEDSAGCAFKNPPADQVPAGLPASAGALIDRAGLKGHRIGGAEVSSKHANFIIAHEGCRAGDLLDLMEHIQETVADRLGVKLEREVVVWR